MAVRSENQMTRLTASLCKIERLDNNAMYHLNVLITKGNDNSGMKKKRAYNAVDSIAAPWKSFSHWLAAATKRIFSLQLYRI